MAAKDIKLQLSSELLYQTLAGVIDVITTVRRGTLLLELQVRRIWERTPSDADFVEATPSY